jgi:hypothetical protein
MIEVSGRFDKPGLGPAQKRHRKEEFGKQKLLKHSRHLMTGF